MCVVAQHYDFPVGQRSFCQRDCCYFHSSPSFSLLPSLSPSLSLPPSLYFTGLFFCPVGCASDRPRLFPHLCLVRDLIGSVACHSTSRAEGGRFWPESIKPTNQPILQSLCFYCRVYKLQTIQTSPCKAHLRRECSSRIWQAKPVQVQNKNKKTKRKPSVS